MGGNYIQVLNLESTSQSIFRDGQASENNVHDFQNQSKQWINLTKKKTQNKTKRKLLKHNSTGSSLEYIATISIGNLK